MGFDVRLTPADAARFEREPRLAALTRVHHTFDGREIRFMRMDESGRCVALAGQLGCVHCAIYEDRPELCREVAPGSECCLDSRRRFGLPILE